VTCCTQGEWPLGLPVVKVLWSVLEDVYDIRVETIYNENGWVAVSFGTCCDVVCVRSHIATARHVEL
jgi:hypothetical protein